MTRVLVVEDEESFRDALGFMLRKEGYDVEVVDDGLKALEQYDRNGADLILLDLMLPGMSGTDVCRTIRQKSRVPIIMVTAKDTEIDKVVGLELGADDYVTKPFSSRELTARIKAVLRRGPDADEPTPALSRPARSGWTWNGMSSQSRGAEIALPLKEFDLLELLLRNSGPGPDPQPVDRPGMGVGLRRRHQDPGCPRQTTAVEDRDRSGQSPASDDSARPRLQVRGLRPDQGAALGEGAGASAGAVPSAGAPSSVVAPSPPGALSECPVSWFTLTGIGVVPSGAAEA